MIERLLHALSAFATPVGVPRATFTDVADDARGLALDYADALRLVIDCQQIHLTPAQRSTLEQLDSRLDTITSGADSEVWARDESRSGAEWREVRRLAGAALEALKSSQ